MRLHANVVVTGSSDKAVILEKLGEDINARKQDRQLANLPCRVIG